MKGKECYARDGVLCKRSALEEKESHRKGVISMEKRACSGRE